MPVEKTEQYPPLALALSTTMDALTKRTHPLYSVIRVIAAFEREHGHFPEPKDLPVLKVRPIPMHAFSYSWCSWELGGDG